MGFHDEEEGLVKSIKKDFNNLNIENYKIQLKEQIGKDKDIKFLSNQLCFDNPNSIVEFGKEAYEAIAKISDEILKYLRIDNEDNMRNVLNKLTVIMDSFDISDFSEEKEGFFKKFLKKEKTIEFLMDKYGKLTFDIESFYRGLKYQEKQIENSNRKLEAMLFNNIKYYELLEKYLFIAETSKVNLENKIYNNNGSFVSKMEENKKILLLDMLEKRIEDFKIAEIIAMETIIMINEIEKANINILGKIQNSFIIALPIFKNQLSQVIILKKQQLKLKSINAVKKKSNKLLEGNSKLNIVLEKADDNTNSLEQSFDNIITGIAETKVIEEKKEKVTNINKANLEKLLRKLNI